MLILNWSEDGLRTIGTFYVENVNMFVFKRFPVVFTKTFKGVRRFRDNLRKSRIAIYQNEKLSSLNEMVKQDIRLNFLRKNARKKRTT